MDIAMECLWRDACAEEAFFNDNSSAQEPTENTALSVHFRAVFGIPFARGYDIECSDSKIVSVIHAGAAEVHIVDCNNTISTLGKNQETSTSKLYGQVDALYRQHLAHGRKVRFSQDDEISYRIHRAILISINRNYFGSQLQINEDINQRSIDGKIHEVVYEVTHIGTRTGLLLKETG